MYRFTKVEESDMGVFSPEVVITTKTECVSDVLDAFQGFLVACTFHPSVVAEAFLKKAEELKDEL
jgi:hypothetical protein